MQNKSADYYIPQWVCIALIAIIVSLFYYPDLNLRLEGRDFEYILNAEKNNFFPFSPHTRPLIIFCYSLAMNFVGIQKSHIMLHVLSRVVHLIVSVCIFFLMKRLTRNTLIGLSSAVLFAGFCIHAITIPYCWQIGEEMWVMFGMLTILSYIRYLDGKGFLNYLISLMFLSLALLSRENAQILPFLIFLVDLYLRKEEGQRALSIKMCLPFLFLSLLYPLVLMLSNVGSSFGNTLSAAGNLWSNLYSGEIIYNFLYYLYHALMPVSAYNTSFNPIALSIIILLFVTVSFVAVYALTNKSTRGLLLFLGGCMLIVIFHLTSTLEPRRLCSPAVFSMSLMACLIYYGAEKVSGYNIVQSFFLQTVRRRLMIAVIVCSMFIQIGLIGHVINVMAQTIHALRPYMDYSIPHGSIEILGLLIFLSLIVLYVKSSERFKNFISLLCVCTLILMYPTFVSNFIGRGLYLLAASSLALLACIISYGIDKSYVNRLHNRLPTRRTVMFCILIFVIHANILLTNLNYMHGAFRSIKTGDRARNLTAEVVRQFLLQTDTKRNFYLLNFPIEPPFNTLDTTSFNRETKWMYSYSIREGKWMYSYSMLEEKWMYSYYCNLGLTSYDIHALPVKIYLGKRLAIGAHKWYLPAGTELSIDEFNELTKNPGNKMLFLDQAKEQVIDISGMDYDSAQKLLVANDV